MWREGLIQTELAARDASLHAPAPAHPTGPKVAGMAEFVLINGLIKMKAKAIPQKSLNDAPKEYIFENQRSKEKNKDHWNEGLPKG